MWKEACILPVLVSVYNHLYRLLFAKIKCDCVGSFERRDVLGLDESLHLGLCHLQMSTATADCKRFSELCFPLLESSESE
jgi:hypothetical protein